MAHAEAGGSLPVPNVQELAQNYNISEEQIPKRYIRLEETAEEVTSGHDISSATAISIIDLNKLLDSRSSKEECAKLGSACKQWGFFQLINHGVPDEVICNFRNDMAEFFKQPLETKQVYVYSMVPGNLEGYGQHFVVSENQKLDWADMFYLMPRPSDSRDMRFWPSHPPSFSNSIDRYSSEAAKLVSCLMQFVAMDMGVEPETLLEIFRGQPQSMRMTYYPPCKEAEKVVGLSPHTDGTGLTLLLQANDVQGLQIRMDGKWVSVNALAGAFIVNVGDILEILSNGKYRSIEHRAVVHPSKERMFAAVFHQPCSECPLLFILKKELEMNDNHLRILSNGRYRSIEHRAVVHPSKERMSAAVFHQPCKDAIVGPLPELVEDGEARYSSIGYMDFIERFFAAKLDGRDHLESLKS